MTKNGEPKLVEKCTFPLTGVACVTRIYTSHAVIDIVEGRFVLREKLTALSVEELQSMTGAPLHVEGSVAALIVPEV
ncbi:3-oxoadipate CoA-transferase subunit B [compost metagenome]